MGILKKTFLPWLSGLVGPWMIESLGSSLTWEIRGREHWESLADRPHVLAFWHARILMMAYFFRYRGYHILISENMDGELIARAVAPLGTSVLRGSTSRGASKVFLEAARLLKKGERIAFTPDGPRGPRHSFQAGALATARIGGAPVLPVTASASNAFIFPSWDRFILPRQDARVVIEFLPPVTPPSDKSGMEPARLRAEEDLAEATRRLDEEMGIYI